MARIGGRRRLAAYVALVVTDALGVNPLASLAIVAPLTVAIGYGLQRLVLKRTLGADLLPPLLVTFGLSTIIQNGLLELFTADSCKLQAGPIEVASIQLGGGLAIGVLPLISVHGRSRAHRRAAGALLSYRPVVRISAWPSHKATFRMSCVACDMITAQLPSDVQFSSWARRKPVRI